MKRYVVDRLFDASGWGRTGTNVSWVLADVSTRKILEKSESFEELCIRIFSKYDESTVSFDKVLSRIDVGSFVKKILNAQKQA